MSTTLKQFGEKCGKTGLNVARLRELFSLLARDHFASPSNYIDLDEQLKCLFYDDDSSKNRLVIGPTFTDLVTDTDAAAGVYVSCRQMLFEKMVIANRAGWLPDFSAEVLVKKAVAHMVIACKHGDADVAILMAESMLTYLEGMRPLIYHLVPGLLDYNCVELGEVKQDRKQPQARYTAELSVKTEYQLLITAYEESHRLKKIGIDVRVSTD